MESCSLGKSSQRIILEDAHSTCCVERLWQWDTKYGWCVFDPDICNILEKKYEEYQQQQGTTRHIRHTDHGIGQAAWYFFSDDKEYIRYPAKNERLLEQAFWDGEMRAKIVPGLTGEISIWGCNLDFNELKKYCPKFPKHTESWPPYASLHDMELITSHSQSKLRRIWVSSLGSSVEDMKYDLSKENKKSTVYGAPSAPDLRYHLVSKLTARDAAKRGTQHQLEDNKSLQIQVCAEEHNDVFVHDNEAFSQHKNQPLKREQNTSRPLDVVSKECVKILLIEAASAFLETSVYNNEQKSAFPSSSTSWEPFAQRQSLGYSNLNTAAHQPQLSCDECICQPHRSSASCGISEISTFCEYKVPYEVNTKLTNNDNQCDQENGRTGKSFQGECSRKSCVESANSSSELECEMRRRGNTAVEIQPRCTKKEPNEEKSSILNETSQTGNIVNEVVHGRSTNRNSSEEILFGTYENVHDSLNRYKEKVCIDDGANLRNRKPEKILKSVERQRVSKKKQPELSLLIKHQEVAREFQKEFLSQLITQQQKCFDNIMQQQNDLVKALKNEKQSSDDRCTKIETKVSQHLCSIIAECFQDLKIAIKAENSEFLEPNTQKKVKNMPSNAKNISLPVIDKVEMLRMIAYEATEHCKKKNQTENIVRRLHAMLIKDIKNMVNVKTDELKEKYPNEHPNELEELSSLVALPLHTPEEHCVATTNSEVLKTDDKLVTQSSAGNRNSSEWGEDVPIEKHVDLSDVSSDESDDNFMFI